MVAVTQSRLVCNLKMKLKYLKRGFTLMEVLVALVVLSIGLLGMAGMQLFSLSSNRDAYIRTQATYFAYDLIDKIRANRNVALVGGYNTAFSAIPAFINCQTTTSNCSPNQLANFDLLQWKCALGAYQGNSSCVTPNNLTAILPNGDGSVTRNGSEITVTVQWTERGNNESISVTAEL